MGSVFFCPSRLRTSLKTNVVLLTMPCATVVGLVGVATATSTWLLFAASFSSDHALRVRRSRLFIADLAPEARRGRTVGMRVRLLGGIMLVGPRRFLSRRIWAGAPSSGVLLSDVIDWCGAFRLMLRHQRSGGKHYFQIRRFMVGCFATCPCFGDEPCIRR